LKPARPTRTLLLPKGEELLSNCYQFFARDKKHSKEKHSKDGEIKNFRKKMMLFHKKLLIISQIKAFWP